MSAVFIAALSLGVGATTTLGQGVTRPSTRSAFAACSDDVKRLCNDVKPGQGRVYRCLQEKEAQVAPACKDQLQQRRAEFREERSACRDDAQRFCKDVRPGQGRVAACLKSHEAELSPACKRERPGP